MTLTLWFLLGLFGFGGYCCYQYQRVQQARAEALAAYQEALAAYEASDEHDPDYAALVADQVETSIAVARGEVSLDGGGFDFDGGGGEQ